MDQQQLSNFIPIKNLDKDTSEIVTVSEENNNSDSSSDSSSLNLLSSDLPSSDIDLSSSDSSSSDLPSSTIIQATIEDVIISLETTKFDSDVDKIQQEFSQEMLENESLKLESQDALTSENSSLDYHDINNGVISSVYKTLFNRNIINCDRSMVLFVKTIDNINYYSMIINNYNALTTIGGDFSEEKDGSLIKSAIRETYEETLDTFFDLKNFKEIDEYNWYTYPSTIYDNNFVVIVPYKLETMRDCCNKFRKHDKEDFHYETLDIVWYTAQQIQMIIDISIHNTPNKTKYKISSNLYRKKELFEIIDNYLPNLDTNFDDYGKYKPHLPILNNDTLNLNTNPEDFSDVSLNKNPVLISWEEFEKDPKAGSAHTSAYLMLVYDNNTYFNNELEKSTTFNNNINLQSSDVKLPLPKDENSRVYVLNPYGNVLVLITNNDEYTKMKLYLNDQNLFICAITRLAFMAKKELLDPSNPVKQYNNPQRIFNSVFIDIINRINNYNNLTTDNLDLKKSQIEKISQKVDHLSEKYVNFRRLVSNSNDIDIPILKEAIDVLSFMKQTEKDSFVLGGRFPSCNLHKIYTNLMLISLSELNMLYSQTPPNIADLHSKVFKLIYYVDSKHTKNTKNTNDLEDSENTENTKDVKDNEKFIMMKGSDIFNVLATDELVFCEDDKTVMTVVAKYDGKNIKNSCLPRYSYMHIRYENKDCTNIGKNAIKYAKDVTQAYNNEPTSNFKNLLFEVDYSIINTKTQKFNFKFDEFTPTKSFAYIGDYRKDYKLKNLLPLRSLSSTVIPTTSTSTVIPQRSYLSAAISSPSPSSNSEKYIAPSSNSEKYGRAPSSSSSSSSTSERYGRAPSSSSSSSSTSERYARAPSSSSSSISERYGRAPSSSSSSERYARAPSSTSSLNTGIPVRLTEKRSYISAATSSPKTSVPSPSSSPSSRASTITSSPSSRTTSSPSSRSSSSRYYQNSNKYDSDDEPEPKNTFRSRR